LIMAEVAGLVLGGIPIVIWALEKYAEPYSEYRNSRRSIETLRAGLVLQNRQLQRTLSNVGLEEQCSLKELQECFQAKFPESSKELTSLVIRMNDIIVELIKHLDIETPAQV
jgi:hypothetical protein